jgi:hypothetical protein
MVKHRARAISRAVNLVFMAIFLSWGEYCACGRRCGVSLILPFPRLFCKSGEEIGALLFPRECGIMEKKQTKVKKAGAL